MHKVLYVLKNDLRQWYCCLETFPYSLEFQTRISDPSTFTSEKSIIILILVSYVENPLVIQEKFDEIQTFLLRFRERFEVKEQETLQMFLGISIKDTRKSVKLKHSHMIVKTLLFFNMKTFNLVLCPMQPEIYLFCAGKDDILDDVTPYQQLTGLLEHLSCSTRPNISYVVEYLSRFMHKPTTTIWASAESVLQYLKGSNIF